MGGMKKLEATRDQLMSLICQANNCDDDRWQKMGIFDKTFGKCKADLETSSSEFKEQAAKLAS